MLSNFTVSSKIKILSVYIILIFAMIMIISLYKMHNATKQIPKLNTCTAFVDASRNAEALFKELRISAIKAPMTETEEELKSFDAAYSINRDNFNMVIPTIIAGCENDEECLHIVHEMEMNLIKYDRAKENVFRLTREDNRRDAFHAIEEHLVPIGKDIDIEVSKLIRYAGLSSEKIIRDVKHSTNPTSLLTPGIIGLLSVIFMVVIIGRSIINPIRKLADDANVLAEGDLRTYVTIGSNDEIGTLANSFNQVVDYLRSIISTMHKNSDMLSNNAQNLRLTNKSVYDSNEKILEKAVSVSEASTELTKTSNEITNNCSEAFNNSATAHNTALASKEITRDTVAEIKSHSARTHEQSLKIKEFGEKTKDIGSIIDSIRNIAEQTNLLALNAAIEAARAGSNGRGFAVVADEVRSLASRTTESTQEITDMISSVQQMADEISATMESHLQDIIKIEEHSHEVEKSLDNINHAVDIVYQQLTHIATATQQQNVTCRNIDTMIQAITDATRETAQAAKNSLISSEKVGDISEAMSKNINLFKL